MSKSMLKHTMMAQVILRKISQPHTKKRKNPKQIKRKKKQCMHSSLVLEVTRKVVTQTPKILIRNKNQKRRKKSRQPKYKTYFHLTILLKFSNNSQLARLIHKQPACLIYLIQDHKLNKVQPLNQSTYKHHSLVKCGVVCLKKNQSLCKFSL